MQKTQVQSLEKGMATHSSTLAWRIPWAEEPGGPQSWGCKELDTTEWLTLWLFLGVKLKVLCWLTSSFKFFCNILQNFLANPIELLGYMVILCLSFWGTNKLLSTMVTPFYIPTSNVPVSPSFIIVKAGYFLSFFKKIIAILMDMLWYLFGVLICISLND